MNFKSVSGGFLIHLLFLSSYDGFSGVNYNSFLGYPVRSRLPIYLRFSHLFNCDRPFHSSSGSDCLHRYYAMKELLLKLDDAKAQKILQRCEWLQWAKWSSQKD
jgi:hypothetical protein